MKSVSIRFCKGRVVVEGGKVPPSLLKKIIKRARSHWLLDPVRTLSPYNCIGGIFLQYNKRTGEISCSEGYEGWFDATLVGWNTREVSMNL